MKNIKKIVIAAAVLPMALTSASAYAFGGKDSGQHKGGMCGGGDMGKGMMRDLDLTDEQKEQFKEMRKAGKEQMKAKFAENGADMMAARQAQQAKVSDLVLADNFDEAAARALASEMVEKQTERRVNMLKKQHEMLSILTPEQKVKFKELQAEKMQKCQEKMEKRKNK
ncbi:CpxP family protein [Vibrio maerlii]|uniref:CpxP family protein n=1 Tax=Vibrio maerlii TaxID=2231648 RepID=UPI000E3D481E|nr:CpxP family protein [Vibrio maerlii]